MFDQDRVNLLKKDGSTVNDIAATISGSDLIVIKLNRNQGKTILIEPGEMIFRKLSNGGEDTFQVVDPCFYERGPGSTGPHYQTRVKKLGLPEAKAAVQSITYNFTGHNSRVNIDSTDNSTNTVLVNSQVNEYLEELKKEILSQDLPLQQQEEALEVISEVRDQFASGKPKRSVVSALLGSLPHVANVLKIGAAIAAFL